MLADRRRADEWLFGALWAFALAVLTAAMVKLWLVSLAILIQAEMAALDVTSGLQSITGLQSGRTHSSSRSSMKRTSERS